MMDAIKLLSGEKFTALHRLLTAFVLTLLVPAVLDLRTDVAVIKSRLENRASTGQTNHITPPVVAGWSAFGKK